MTARADLAAIIETANDGWSIEVADTARLADAIIAAGWQAPSPDPEQCPHEFYQYCGICGVNADDWYEDRP